MINKLIKRHKLNLAFLGDILVFFVSLVFVLYIRYGNKGFPEQFQVHIYPFLIVLVIWLTIFYISNLYTYKAFSSAIEIIRGVTTTILINFFFTITIFYIFSRFFNLTPKFNLVIFTIVFSALDMLWRYELRRIFMRKIHCSKVLIISSSPLIKTITKYIDENPQLGYSLFSSSTDRDAIIDCIKNNGIQLVVVDRTYLKDINIAKELYDTLSDQTEIMVLSDFYELLFASVPLEEIEEEWFIREITDSKSLYEPIKRFIEIILAILMTIILLPFSIIIGIIISFTSRGRAIYSQKRIGKGNIPFMFYKFRTMYIDKDGPLWTRENDERITPVGRFLRHTHLDEIPQLINVIKNDISFIGPRPERVELVKMYETIPFYKIRHTIKPGIMGWAQLNYIASTSIEEAKEKFQFDLYYIKNRSLTLDLFILIKTVRTIFLKNK